MLNMQPKPLDSRSLAIHDRAIACARRFLLAEAALLRAIMEVDSNRVYEKFALPALTPYCVKMLGLSEEVAASLVRVARKSQSVPAILKALEEKRLTLFKAKTIASVVTVENAEHWIEQASKLTKDQLEREVAMAGSKEKVRIKLVLTREEFEQLKRVRELISKSLGREASWDEAIAYLLEWWLERKDPLRKADRNPSYSHNDRSQERSPTKPLRLPAHIKHAVNRRDRGRCQARLPDGSTCGDTRWTHFHHLVPKSERGADSVENLITLCSAHHRQWHEAH